MHAARDLAAGRVLRLGAATQASELGDEFAQQRLEAPPGALERRRHRLRLAVDADHQVDRPVLEMHAAVGQPGAVCAHRAPAGSIGQGFEASQPTSFERARARASATGTTRSTWPPSRA